MHKWITPRKGKRGESRGRWMKVIHIGMAETRMGRTVDIERKMAIWNRKT
jgi:hypothetical protein